MKDKDIINEWENEWTLYIYKMLTRQKIKETIYMYMYADI